MSDSQILDVSDDGIAAGHPERVERPRLVAPSMGDEHNTLRPPLVTVGCALLPDRKFDFDSSLILPEASRSFRKLVRLVQAKPGSPLSVFGHADPVGQDAYNKALSGRRALAVYAVLVRDTELWERKLYGEALGGDRWGTRSLQIMLDALGYPPGDIDGLLGPDTKEAIKSFQGDHELPPSGSPTRDTRKKLFERYMDFLCADDSGRPFTLAKTDFLAQGSDRDGKGDYQGCGEFNPVLLFSKEEQEEFKKPANHEARNEANAPNRRVVVYLFRPGTRVEPRHWPCPPAKDGTGRDCKKRFWSDGEDRRTRLLDGERREFQKTEDTFACRFYHGLAEFSPCEAALKLWTIRLVVDGAGGEPVPLKGRRFAVIAGDTASAPIFRGRSDDAGIVRVPVFDERVAMKLKIDASGYLFGDPPAATGGGTAPAAAGAPAESAAPGSAGAGAAPPRDEWEGEERFVQIHLNCGALVPMDPPAAAPVRQRLHNLGYGPSKPDEWEGPALQSALRAFQRKHGLEETGEGDEPTRAKLKEVHGS
jgi:outer membrane protein OmpA-like peptidoglycan-associated protein